MLPILTNFLYIGFIAALIAILILLAFMLLRKDRKKVEKEPISQEFLDQLINALGGLNNILNANKEHQRLKVIVKNVKAIHAQVLKDLELAAFLKGKEVTLLIKNQPDKVLAYLNEQRKEV